MMVIMTRSNLQSCSLMPLQSTVDTKIQSIMKGNSALYSLPTVFQVQGGCEGHNDLCQQPKVRCTLLENLVTITNNEVCRKQSIFLHAVTL